MGQPLVILKRPAEFQQFRRSKTVAGPSLRMRWVDSRQNLPRFGFIVPKKVLAHAADRHKVTRRLKAILHYQLGHIQSRDYLFFPSAAALRKTHTQLQEEVINLFKRTGTWKY